MKTFTLRVYNDGDNEGFGNMRVKDAKIYLEQFSKEITSETPNILKLIIFGLRYIKFVEQLNIAHNRIFKDLSVTLDLIKTIELKNAKPNTKRENITGFDKSNLSVKQIQTQIGKLSKNNLKKLEINHLILEVSELKFITKIENPELKDSINFYNELVDFLKTIVQHIQDNQDIKTPLQLGQAKPEKKPFRDDSTAELFEYIVNNWDYNAATKWGYIWEYLFTNNNGKLTNKTDYETYIRERFNFTKGKPNYENCVSPKRFLELDELKEQHLENLDLN
jgi:ribosomal protein L22